MKKNFVYSILLCLMLLVSFNFVYASTDDFISLILSLLSKNFGGTITDTKAKDIKNLEDQGYTCNVIGSTIEIKPQNEKMPSSYMIPATVKSSTKNKTSTDQKIIGKYNGKTTITCEKECPPTVCTSIVVLDKVKMYGNSKF
jgi:hypothetical protein